jgi:hypothetical protein
MSRLAVSLPARTGRRTCVPPPGAGPDSRPGRALGARRPGSRSSGVLVAVRGQLGVRRRLLSSREGLVAAQPAAMIAATVASLWSWRHGRPAADPTAATASAYPPPSHCFAWFRDTAMPGTRHVFAASSSASRDRAPSAACMSVCAARIEANESGTGKSPTITPTASTVPSDLMIERRWAHGDLRHDIDRPADHGLRPGRRQIADRVVDLALGAVLDEIEGPPTAERHGGNGRARHREGHGLGRTGPAVQTHHSFHATSLTRRRRQ